MSEISAYKLRNIPVNSTFYVASETDAQIQNKINDLSGTYYNKTENDNKIIDLSNTYYPQLSVYTKSQVDAKLSASPIKDLHFNFNELNESQMLSILITKFGGIVENF